MDAYDTDNGVERAALTLRDGTPVLIRRLMADDASGISRWASRKAASFNS
jgi:hypothetical protein